MEAIFSSAYLAPVQYYAKLLVCDKAYIEAHDSYVKQTYRNRCIIADANGSLALTIPTEKTVAGNCPIRDIRISDHGNWRHRHWNALEAAYRHTPFFLYYEDDFRPFYEKKVKFLYDFNLQLTELVCSFLSIDTTLLPTEQYAHPTEACTDFRDIISPKRQWQDDSEFSPKEYYQVFKERHGFIPNLSIVDLLFNMGPESIVTLYESSSRQ